MPNVAFLALPSEIIWLIGEHLETEINIFALIKVHPVFHHLLLSLLYKRNISHSGSSALLWCAMQGNEERVRLLLEMDAKVDSAIRLPGQSEWDISSPIHLAANPAIAKILFQYGADVNALSYRGDTPLHRAALDSNQALVKFLLDKGANVDAHGPLERSSVCISHTALHLAIEKHDHQMVQLLIDGNANLEIENGFWERPIHIAVLKNCEAVTKLLVNCGAELNSQDFFDETPLHCAVRNGHIALIRFLLERGAKHDILNKKGQTPLDIATDKGDLRTKGFLSEWGKSI